MAVFASAAPTLLMGATLPAIARWVETTPRGVSWLGFFYGGNLAGAEAIGKVVAERLKDKGITRVVFDRGGYLYHGRIRAVADAAREAGLEF